MAMEVVICVVHIIRVPLHHDLPTRREGGRKGGKKSGKDRKGGCRWESRAAGVASVELRGVGSVAGERHWAARDGT